MRLATVISVISSIRMNQKKLPVHLGNGRKFTKNAANQVLMSGLKSLELSLVIHSNSQAKIKKRRFTWSNVIKPYSTQTKR